MAVDNTERQHDTMTQGAVMDFRRRIFATITATPDKRDDEGRPHFITYGHDNSYCAAIKRDRIITENDSIANFLAENEYFDGEIEYAEPWPCEQCITVEKLKAEEERFNPKPAPAAPRADRVEQPALTDSGDTIADALAFARSIDPEREGFDFLKQMALKAQDESWTPTEKQAAAILKCRKGKPKGRPQPKAAPVEEGDAPQEKKPVVVRNTDAPASERQVNALVNLARVKKPTWFTQLGEAAVRERATKLTRGQASENITKLMNMPKPGKATA